jgi:hypothetical protein
VSTSASFALASIVWIIGSCSSTMSAICSCG